MTRQVKITLAALEVLLLLAIGAGLRHQFSREIDGVVRRNLKVAEMISRHAAAYFAGLEAGHKEFRLRELNEYLSAQLGKGKLFEDDMRRAGSFEVYRLQDLKLGRVRPEIVEAVDFDQPYTVQRDGKNVTVTVPFALDGREAYYGIVRIPTPASAIYGSLLAKNVSVYLTVAFLFGAQAILSWLLLSKRRREILFEKGYLREHALGALKLQRRILDGIIQDHEGGRGAPAPPALLDREEADAEAHADESDSARAESAGEGNVVRLADKAWRKEKSS